nr:unnamed protein product [Spirometra erinaceieuropaei]
MPVLNATAPSPHTSAWSVPCEPSAPTTLNPILSLSVPATTTTTTATAATTTTIFLADTVTTDFSCPHCPRAFTSHIGVVGRLRSHRTETGDPLTEAPPPLSTMPSHIHAPTTYTSMRTCDDGKVTASGDICMQEDNNCFSFANSGGTVDKFMKCYVDCQVTRKETQTYMNYIDVCTPDHEECIDSIFYAQPGEKEPKQVLTKCYQNCESDKAPAPEPETGGFKCDEDSQICVPCTDEDSDCADLSTCEETCGNEA